MEEMTQAQADRLLANLKRDKIRHCLETGEPVPPFNKAEDYYPPEPVKPVDFIRRVLPVTEVLAQLAEEAAELAQSALKLRRVLDGTNPTPVSVEEARASLIMEYGDVLNCMEVLEVPDADVQFLLSSERDEKKIRWCGRIRDAGGYACTGQALDDIGAMLDVPREDMEPDGTYRDRLLRALEKEDEPDV